VYEARVGEVAVYPPTGEQTAYRRIFALQAQQMARLILGETQQYLPYTVR
jgi:CRISPR/Cas system-associated endonuclease Cas1